MKRVLLGLMLISSICFGKFEDSFKVKKTTNEKGEMYVMNKKNTIVVAYGPKVYDMVMKEVADGDSEIIFNVDYGSSKQIIFRDNKKLFYLVDYEEENYETTVIVSDGNKRFMKYLKMNKFTDGIIMLNYTSNINYRSYDYEAELKKLGMGK